MLLFAAGTSFWFFLNSSQQAKLDSAQRNLVYLAGLMKSDYATQLPHGFSLDEVTAPHPPAPPPPRPEPHAVSERPHPAETFHPPPPLPPPQAELAEAPLTHITTSVLRRASDVEGGFYAAHADALAGYAFPTHDGPGGQAEIPGKERPEIEDIAREAVRSGVLQKRSYHGGFDAILFTATPVMDGDRITGAAWLMQRMPGLDAGRSKQLLLGSIGFAAAAVVCAFLTFFITSEVNSGVQTVLARLGTMEGSLGEHPVAARPQLREFEQVLDRVDALSDSLKHQIETQRALEDEMRHRQRLSALGQFAAGVAHELRNPLATIRLRTQMSQRAADIGSVERNSQVTLDEVTRLDTMIERLLYFSRPIHLQARPESLSSICQQRYDTWLPRCEAENVELHWHAGEALYALCDASKLRQVLDNLLENALQAVRPMPAGRRTIVLATLSEEARALIEVRDSGTGLDVEAEAHALEPFFTTKDTGTGLGLSISYEIMQAHGGDLQLRNAGGEGAVATVSLPEVADELG